MPLNARKRRKLTLGAAGFAAVAAAVSARRGRMARAHHLAFASTAALLAPTLIRNCGWFGEVKKNFPTNERLIWLTIDDGPDPENTPAILDVLEHHDAKASFFVIGRRVLQHPELTRQISAAGHQLQNHTWSHPGRTFWAAGPRRAVQEIRSCSRIIFETTGVKPSLFRAPAGLANPFVHAAAEHAGLRMLGWSACGFDGIPHCPDAVLRRILGRIQPGAVVLLHEHQIPSLEQGARARTLDRLLHRLRERGYGTIIPDL